MLACFGILWFKSQCFSRIFRKFVLSSNFFCNFFRLLSFCLSIFGARGKCRRPRPGKHSTTKHAGRHKNSTKSGRLWVPQRRSTVHFPARGAVYRLNCASVFCFLAFCEQVKDAHYSLSQNLQRKAHAPPRKYILVGFSGFHFGWERVWGGGGWGEFQTWHFSVGSWAIKCKVTDCLQSLCFVAVFFASSEWHKALSSANKEIEPMDFISWSRDELR